MKGKYQSKYLSKEESSKKKNGLSVWIAVLAVVAVVAMGLAIFLQSRQGTNQELATEPPTDPVQEVATDPTTEPVQEIRYAEIDTAYGVLKMEESYLDALQHEEIIINNVAVEVFSVEIDGSILELFRICYGDAGMGDLIGGINVDGQVVPVTVKASSYSQEDFQTEELQYTYYAMMEQLNVVLTSVRDNSNFVTSDNMSIILPAVSDAEPQIAQLSYWTVELPGNMLWEESSSGQNYQVSFYGTIAEEMIQLYTITLGDAPESDFLGMFDIDGVKRPVSVKPYGLQDQSDVIADLYADEYATMMETINNVVQVIYADERFSKEMS